MWGRKSKGTLRAKEFVLEDAEGNERAAIRVDAAHNTRLEFKDEQGNVGLFIGLTAAGTPRVWLSYAGGKGSIQLEANNRLSTAGLIIAGTTGKAQVLLGVARNGLPAIALLDPEGNVVFPHDVNGKNGAANSSPGIDWDQLLSK
ncbi:MAG TPA: hypothetical protein HPP77_05110 [Candidatus Hydrogenedentes bacterium]|nr:hypothetical protein [Candidatus Hydrogenedentota bacterium]HIJ74460.1 hypothetical protein [Candidatus Hydrogenedentota bacterium]